MRSGGIAAGPLFEYSFDETVCEGDAGCFECLKVARREQCSSVKRFFQTAQPLSSVRAHFGHGIVEIEKIAEGSGQRGKIEQLRATDGNRSRPRHPILDPQTADQRGC